MGPCRARKKALVASSDTTLNFEKRFANANSVCLEAWGPETQRPVPAPPATSLLRLTHGRAPPPAPPQMADQPGAAGPSSAAPGGSAQPQLQVPYPVSCDTAIFVPAPFLLRAGLRSQGGPARHAANLVGLQRRMP